MMKPPIDWLLAGEPWIEYLTRRDLLGQPEADPEVQTSRALMLEDPGVKNLIDEVAGWPGRVIASHKSSSQPFHKLTFLADLGLRASDPGIASLTSKIMAHQSPEGPFLIPLNIPENHGGTGQETWAWALCDAPVLVNALVKFGLAGEPAVQSGISFLTGLARENGWPCAVSRELGDFRGPGRKSDPCPYATLVMLKLLCELDGFRDSTASRQGAESLLSLWAESLGRHPYMFYMGTDFRKLKAPFVWYDLLHVLEVLSRFPWLKNDPRLGQMVSILSAKADTEGRFTAESVWTAWSPWEFGQKKAPSRWLTLLSWRILKRFEADC
ncbi:hypothetical protein Dform_01154 [Dehalogenimonas formicexedens]|uniref:Uncharacterized protein n=1 Tax=Dehalogenimonas formicexedens TaxID=1839801 RepID=A0A1P8F7N7_9CHLR|nr:hypothetical protein [Dehalogenimonas formicexedens]APV44487.1 hypothetical protein Dform_01154 [Dehalogenimonas formicexedens]